MRRNNLLTTHLWPIRFVRPVHLRVSERRVLLLLDDAQMRARLRRIEQVPLTPPEHKYEVSSVIEVTFCDDTACPEPTLNALLVAHLQITREEGGGGAGVGLYLFCSLSQLFIFMFLLDNEHKQYTRYLMCRNQCYIPCFPPIYPR